VLRRGVPLLAGTHGTYLYPCSRETAEGPDDVAGDACAHFGVVCGYHSKDRSVSVADPLLDDPLHEAKYHRASAYRPIGASFPGSASDDANLLAIRPRTWKAPATRRA
jgi:hypothetical protein